MIELMAGFGRNYVCTKSFFKNIEMLDGSSEMTKHMSPKVIRHQCKLEEFEWPNYEKYDCILGEVSGTLFKNQVFMLYGVETS